MVVLFKVILHLLWIAILDDGKQILIQFIDIESLDYPFIQLLDQLLLHRLFLDLSLSFLKLFWIIHDKLLRHLFKVTEGDDRLFKLDGIQVLVPTEYTLNLVDSVLYPMVGVVACLGF